MDYSDELGYPISGVFQDEVLAGVPPKEGVGDLDQGLRRTGYP
jgi:hypothetical protein